jgi:triacylglycerol lipase
MTVIPSHRAGLWWGRPISELRWQLEWAALLADPVWRGVGVPRGDGSPVLLVPGFLSGDVSLRSLRTWLQRIGYRTYRADIRWNVDCAERALVRLERRVTTVVQRTGQPVRVLGHSRGGLFARALVHRCPEDLTEVITLGSPLANELDCSVSTMAAVTGARAVQRLLRPEARRDGCFTRDCRCAYTSDIRAPLPATVPLTSIYTRDDGIVGPSACRPADAECIEVGGSHLGLGVNADVYRHLGRLLARRRPSAEQELS